MNRLAALLPLMLVGCYTGQAAVHPVAMPHAFEPASYSNCYNGVGFFRTEKRNLSSRVPAQFVPRDAEMLGREHRGYALVALIYYACPEGGDNGDRVAIIATPIEDPPIATDLRPVRWNWYEFGRLVNTEAAAREASSRGYSAQAAAFSHTPFREGDTLTSFSVAVSGKRLIDVEAALTDSINFEAQSHRLWHQRSDGRLLSTRLDFEYHHSWIGRFRRCSFDAALFVALKLSDVACTGIGLTEAIESLNYTEQVVIWNAVPR